MRTIDRESPKLLIDDDGLLLVRDRIVFVQDTNADLAIAEGGFDPTDVFVVTLANTYELPAWIERQGGKYRKVTPKQSIWQDHYLRRAYNVDVSIVEWPNDHSDRVRLGEQSYAEVAAKGAGVTFEDIVSLNEDNALRMLANPDCPEAELGYLGSVALRWYPALCAIAGNPQTPATTLTRLAAMAPNVVFDNPAWPLAMLVNPDLLNESPERVQRLWQDRLR